MDVKSFGSAGPSVVSGSMSSVLGRLLGLWVSSAGDETDSRLLPRRNAEAWMERCGGGCDGREIGLIMPSPTEGQARGASSSVGVGMRSSCLREDLPLFRGGEPFQGSVNADGLGNESFHLLVLSLLSPRSGLRTPFMFGLYGRPL